MYMYVYIICIKDTFLQLASGVPCIWGALHRQRQFVTKLHHQLKLSTTGDWIRMVWFWSFAFDIYLWINIASESNSYLLGTFCGYIWNSRLMQYRYDMCISTARATLTSTVQSSHVVFSERSSTSPMCRTVSMATPAATSWCSHRLSISACFVMDSWAVNRTNDAGFILL